MICGFCGHEASGSTVNISEDEVQLRERDASIGWLGRPPRAKVFTLSFAKLALVFMPTVDSAERARDSRRRESHSVIRSH